MKDGPVANACLATMQTYGPWDTKNRRDMEGLAAMIAIMPLAVYEGTNSTTEELAAGGRFRYTSRFHISITYPPLIRQRT